MRGPFRQCSYHVISENQKLAVTVGFLAASSITGSSFAFHYISHLLVGELLNVQEGFI